MHAFTCGTAPLIRRLRFEPRTAVGGGEDGRNEDCVRGNNAAQLQQQIMSVKSVSLVMPRRIVKADITAFDYR